VSYEAHIPLTPWKATKVKKWPRYGRGLERMLVNQIIQLRNQRENIRGSLNEYNCIYSIYDANCETCRNPTTWLNPHLDMSEKRQVITSNIFHRNKKPPMAILARSLAPCNCINTCERIGWKAGEYGIRES